jgi:hypothetical protein
MSTDSATVSKGNEVGGGPHTRELEVEILISGLYVSISSTKKTRNQ